MGSVNVNGLILRKFILLLNVTSRRGKCTGLYLALKMSMNVQIFVHLQSEDFKLSHPTVMQFRCFKTQRRIFSLVAFISAHSKVTVRHPSDFTWYNLSVHQLSETSLLSSS